jgi:two-component system, OmpR family, alkaline phosphatase synthesis response regulator PhoP
VATDQGQPGRQHHILVADDEPHIGRIIKMKLEQGPFRISVAEDGEQALEQIRANDDLELVVLDLMMPGIGGMDVLEQLREEGRIETLPVVVLTAVGEEDQQQKARALGASEFLTKPFSPKKLYSLIAELVGEDPGQHSDGG